MSDSALAETVATLVAHLCQRRWMVAVVESLTGGMLASALAEGPGASDWFKGAVVAYQPEVKRKLLGVSNGPVVSKRCACEMASGVRVALDAEVGIAADRSWRARSRRRATGRNGLAGRRRADSRGASRLLHFDELEPARVCSQSCIAALRLAIDILGTCMRGTGELTPTTP